MTWEIGEVRISRVVEQVVPLPVEFFAEATPADVAAESWLVPDFVDEAGRYRVSIHSFLIEAGGSRIIVDTCAGNSKRRPLVPMFDQQSNPFLPELSAAGFDPDTIDMVVCTHLHVDHVGWNTTLVDGVWTPTFPRARYLLGAGDLAFWTQSSDPMHAPAFADSVQPVIDAGLVDAVAADRTIAPGVHLKMTPGHTPGHMCVWIGEQCVITGDVVHHPIQCGHPEWTATGDDDPDLARTARRKFLAAAAATNALVLGTHFAGTSAGHVVSTAEGGYRFESEPSRI